MTKATPTHDELVAALGLAYEALSGVGEQTEAASAAAYDVLVREAICTSTDPTNHQGDTCPIHEQHDVLVAALEAVEFAAGFPINDTCPACGALEKNSHRIERGHERYCQLAAALRTAG
jgi:hypothetical protein